MITKQRIWIRVAGNASNVKAGKDHGWRCFMRKKFEDPSVQEIPLRNWIPVGSVNGQNFIPGTSAKGGTTSMNNHVVAWIDIFGDITLENDVLEITLRTPNEARES